MIKLTYTCFVETLVFIDDTDAVMFGPDGKDFISFMDELLKKKENNMVCKIIIP